MSTYFTNEVAFEVPEGVIDRSIQVLQFEPTEGKKLSLTLQRLPIGDDSTARYADRTMDECRAAFPDFVLDASRHDEELDAAWRTARHTGEEGVVLAVHAFVPLPDVILWFMLMTEPRWRVDAESLLESIVESIEPRSTP